MNPPIHDLARDHADGRHEDAWHEGCPRCDADYAIHFPPREPAPPRSLTDEAKEWV
jgi:hypothetical protein